MNTTATTVFDIKSANPIDLVARLTVLQEKAADLDTPDSDLPKINKEISDIYLAIRSLKKDRSNELTAIIGKQKTFDFTIKEIFGADAIKSFSDDELTAEAQERDLFTAASTEENQGQTDRVSITPDDVANQVLVGTYNINGKQVEIKIGDYNRKGKIVRQLVPIAREFKTEIIGRGIDGFVEAIKDNEDGKALLLKNHTATVGKTVGQLVFPNIAPINTYFAKTINLDDLEFKLGAMALRIENHKITNKETNAVAYMEKKVPHNEAQAAMQGKAKKA